MMYKLRLPDIFNLIHARNKRIEAQNSEGTGTKNDPEILENPTESEIIQMFAGTGGNFTIGLA